MSIVLIASGCGSRTGTAPSTETAESGAALPGSFGGQDPGSLLSANTMPTVDRRLSAVSSVAARITYLSTSGVDGSRQRISGTVFAPAGTPPPDGWPVIGYGHATTGIQPECAPSLDPMLLGLSTTVTGLVKAGFVVAVSDYQGLGLDGSYHPYLDATTEGYNLIDSVRAARKLVATTSKRWAAFGGSQGGQAAWAANELAGQYAPELELVGSASYSPPLAIDGFADAAASGTLTSEQRLALLQIVAALADESTDFNLDDYRRGLAAEKWNVLLACKGPDAAERDQLGDRLTADDVAPASPQAADALRRRLLAESLPRQPATAPLLIVYGGQDQLVSPTWTSRALDAACRMGDVIQIELQPDKGHADVDGSTAFPWINDRFAGEPARNDCPALLPPVEPSE
ncbi:lipase [Mycobacterium yunnanensis]|uniref:Lipase n=2 Tax=Mycobacterium yunnanensis TaxID=368477 RepID=A0A9X3C2Y3_9MYCO|nr:lipase [Mycobacterium yunnanensis]